MTTSLGSFALMATMRLSAVDSKTGSRRPQLIHTTCLPAIFSRQRHKAFAYSGKPPTVCCVQLGICNDIVSRTHISLPELLSLKLETVLYILRRSTPARMGQFTEHAEGIKLRCIGALRKPAGSQADRRSTTIPDAESRSSVNIYQLCQERL